MHIVKYLKFALLARDWKLPCMSVPWYQARSHVLMRTEEGQLLKFSENFLPGLLFAEDVKQKKVFAILFNSPFGKERSDRRAVLSPDGETLVLSIVYGCRVSYSRWFTDGYRKKNRCADISFAIEGEVVRGWCFFVQNVTISWVCTAKKPPDLLKNI